MERATGIEPAPPAWRQVVASPEDEPMPSLVSAVETLRSLSRDPGCRDHPPVEALAADAEWIPHALVGTGDEPVEGHRHGRPQLAHRLLCLSNARLLRASG